MKTLEGYTICYDGVCPMCALYTGAFVRTGMLDGKGRIAYQALPAELSVHLNKERAVNEIALVNRHTGQVHYGIDSLFTILGHSFRWLQPLFRFRFFRWSMGKVYSFISYNRRIIIPGPADELAGEQPSFHPGYRLAYLVVTWLVTAFILMRYSVLLEGMIPPSSYFREFAICGGQILWQAALLYFVDRRKRWTYLGNMMTISFGGALALLPMLLNASWIGREPELYAGYFFLVAGCMFFEHLRRMRLLQLGGLPTASWVLYRIVLLILILFL